MPDFSTQQLKIICAAQAIRRREQNKRFVDIAQYLGVHRNTVSDWWQQYQQEGEAALEQQLRGKKLGEGRRLSEVEQANVQRQMREHFRFGVGD